MASVVPENWPLITRNEHTFSPVEAMEMDDDNALLMSLLQDSQVKDGGAERLLSVMQSLEAEIDPSVTMNDHNHSISSSASKPDDCQHCSILSEDHMDFSWINDVEMAISSPAADGMNMWCSMDMTCDYYEFDNRVEIGQVGDYYFYENSHQQVFDLEEPAGHNISLWQQTYEPVFYGQ